MAGWKPGERLFAWVTALGVALCVALVTGFAWIPHMFDQADADSYRLLGEGRIEQVALPFASRQLAPLLVHWLHQGLHVPVVDGFIAEGVLALLLFLGTVLFLLVRSGAPRWMLPAVAGLFFWAQMCNELMMPDLFYGALLCGMLLLLREGRTYAAVSMLFLLAVARESTLLTLVCLLLAGIGRMRWREMAAAVAATAAGILLVKRLTVQALPNAEHISPTLYLVAKMPWNVIRNIFGLTPWSDVNQQCAVPQWQMVVHLGPVHGVGLCSLTPEFPVQTVAYALASFGLLPLLMLAAWRARPAVAGAPGVGGPAQASAKAVGRVLMVRFCVVLGASSFLLAPLLGETFQRLYAYGWPLFLVALPLLLGASRGTFTSAWAAWSFVAMHLVCCWMQVRLIELPGMLWLVLLWLAGWFLLRTRWVDRGDREQLEMRLETL
jgi:hypothetical protein